MDRSFSTFISGYGSGCYMRNFCQLKNAGGEKSLGVGMRVRIRLFLTMLAKAHATAAYPLLT